MNKVLAVVGMAGAGKTEVVKIIQKKTKWPSVYFGEATFDRLKEEGLDVNYANEKIIREKIRAEHGMGAYAVLALPKIKDLFEKNNTVIAESLYSWDEYKIMKDKFGDDFKVVAILASPAIRFKRLSNRNNERPIKNYQEFQTRDYSEIENIAKAGPIARADYFIVNEGSVSHLKKSIDDVLLSVGK